MFTYGLVSDNEPLGISVSNGIEFNIHNNPRNNIQRLNASKPGERYLSFAEIKKIDLIFNESPLELDPDLKALLMLGIYTCGQRPFELAHSQKILYDASSNKLTISKEFTKLNRNNVMHICESAKKPWNNKQKNIQIVISFFRTKITKSN
ncbi:hypothetical protein QF91_002479 [Salmonella enterica subsp. salamae]|nr:hypothetical protein [Salmonella enterica]EDV0903314.1 hypothetical protein [Salmonella enterica subsp. salamae]EHM1750942.1 hypothetical protein [Salmonella enterica subsp. salamae serovar 40:c:e,n,x,z15]HCM1999308.1 hypothetical protein [Salmonella enterica subsp. salamae serovar [1],40:z35:e,n,x,z15]EIU8981685.1 hypothetical protein [Salmonella enterica]